VVRGGAGICVRPHRYALARWLAVPLGPDELGLHECDVPLCVKVCDPGAVRQHVVVGSQGGNMRRMARMRRGGGRRAIPSDGLHARRDRSVALRAVLREQGWDRAAVEAALLGDVPRCGEPRAARRSAGQRCGGGPVDRVLMNVVEAVRRDVHRPVDGDDVRAGYRAGQVGPVGGLEHASAP
jgi:hypothetical protein